jgi:hypothetical protein
MNRPARPRYEHRQGGGFMRLTIGLPVVVLIVIASLQPQAWPALLLAGPFLLLILACFDGLTIRIAGDALTWRFGHLGFPRGRVRLDEIAAASLTRTTFWEGWGIRWTRRGWLYNVSGCDAVLIQRRDGRSLLLGTDEPRRLKAAIDAALKETRP